MKRQPLGTISPGQLFLWAERGQLCKRLPIKAGKRSQWAFNNNISKKYMGLSKAMVIIVE